MPRPENTRVSIVVPLHNELACLGELYERLLKVLPENYEIILVDDRSADNTYQTIVELAAHNPAVRGVRLARNVGHQSALACGLKAASGDVVITMDGDLQHPPELIPDMLKLWHDGWDIVDTIRNNPQERSGLKELFSRVFYSLFNRISEIEITPRSSDFRLLDRKCVDALNAMEERAKFYRGMTNFIGFNKVSLNFDCDTRFAGEPSFTFRKSLRLAMDGVFSFSTVGLKIPLWLGVFFLVVTILYFVTAGFLVLFDVSELAPGWLSISFLILMVFGLQLCFFGVLGLYISHMFDELKRRPVYFVDEAVGIDKKELM